MALTGYCDTIRGEIEAERISYDELTELQSLVEHIDKSDIQLLEAAGVEENLCPDNLEWTEGGDGVEFEYWKDTETEKLFKVEIEIVRDFNGKEEVK